MASNLHAVRAVRSDEEVHDVAKDAELVKRAGFPPAGTWTFDQPHTRIGFVARHMLSRIHGRFATFEGRVVIAERPEDSWVEVEIDAGSIGTDTQMRDDHLRSGDFLEIETYPKLTFRSTELRPTGERTFDLVGDLTIKAITREVVLSAEFLGWGAGTSPDAPPLAAFYASTEIDREDWDMTWNVVVETGGWLVGRKVQIEIDAEINLQA
jgi:polyisoprenoid-binding protein YceI